MAGYHGGLKLGGRRVLPYKPTPRTAADRPNMDLRPPLEQKKLDQTLGIKVKRVRLQPSERNMQLIGSAAVILMSVLLCRLISPLYPDS
jgi:hypothetical protein